MLHLCLLQQCMQTDITSTVPASGLSRHMLHLFLATMDAGHFWSVFAAQM